MLSAPFFYYDTNLYCVCKKFYQIHCEVYFRCQTAGIFFAKLQIYTLILAIILM